MTVICFYTSVDMTETHDGKAYTSQVPYSHQNFLKCENVVGISQVCKIPLAMDIHNKRSIDVIGIVFKMLLKSERCW